MRWTDSRRIWRACALAGLAGLSLACLAVQPARAQDAGFDLITPAEARRDAAEPAPPPRTRALRPDSLAAAVAPTIQVISPESAGHSITSPVRIEVAFKAPPDSRIVPSTFRLLYGVLKIDLTDRVNKRATILESGVVVEQARVPDGTHRLIVRVADDKGRLGEQEMIIRVGP
jgi:hypothetical protein